MKKHLIFALLMGPALASAKNTYVEYATVIDSQPIYVETPSKEICTETRQETVSRPVDERGYAGPIIGGIAGGLLGRTVGKGTSKEAATAIGAIAGAIVGDRIGNDRQNDPEYLPPVRTCRFVPGERTVVGYDVVARYNKFLFKFESKNYISAGTSIPVNINISPSDEYNNVGYTNNYNQKRR